MFGIVFGYSIRGYGETVIFWDLFYGGHEYMYIDAKPGALFGHVLMTLKSSGVSCERLNALGINLN